MLFNLKFIGYFLCPGHYTEHLMTLSELNCYYFHYTKDEVGVQRGLLTCTSSQNLYLIELGFKFSPNRYMWVYLQAMVGMN